MSSALARQAIEIEAMSPTVIMVAGDWHGNTSWGLQVIRAADRLLPRDGPRLIIQVGDMGIWGGPHGGKYLLTLSRELEDKGMTLWFLDGNHENFTLLNALRCDDPGIVSIDAAGRIYHLPRAFRWTWHSRVWMALGGAHSVDKALRIEGTDWWPEEAITDEQETAASVGSVDVLLSHDCPSGVHHEFGIRPRDWAQEDIDLSDRHRERLQRVVDMTRPEHLVHGHLHKGYWRSCNFGYGNVLVTGLDMDGTRFNCALLDTRTMNWEPV